MSEQDVELVRKALEKYRTHEISVQLAIEALARLTADRDEWAETARLRARTIADLTADRERLGNELAQERSKPGGSFDQWDRLQRLEVENERLVAAAWSAVTAADCRCGPEPGVTMPPDFKCARCRLEDALAPQADAAKGRAK